MTTKIQLIQQLTSKQALELYQEHGSITGVLNAHGIKNDPRCRAFLSSKLKQATGTSDISTKHRPKDDLTVEQIREHAAQCSSVTQLLILMKLQPVGGNFSHVANLIKKHDIKLLPRTQFKVGDAEIYCANSTYNRRMLARRVKQSNWMPYACSCTLSTEWQGKPLTLHLDHIDGDSTNNKRSNLRWMCPNCHSQTSTYGGRNNKKK